jgi:hypothetical protein
LGSENLQRTANISSSGRFKVKNSYELYLYRIGAPSVKEIIGTIKYSGLPAIFVLTNGRSIWYNDTKWEVSNGIGGKTHNKKRMKDFERSEVFFTCY